MHFFHNYIQTYTFLTSERSKKAIGFKLVRVFCFYFFVIILKIIAQLL